MSLSPLLYQFQNNPPGPYHSPQRPAMEVTKSIVLPMDMARSLRHFQPLPVMHFDVKRLRGLARRGLKRFRQRHPRPSAIAPTITPGQGPHLFCGAGSLIGKAKGILLHKNGGAPCRHYRPAHGNNCHSAPVKAARRLPSPDISPWECPEISPRCTFVLN